MQSIQHCMVACMVPWKARMLLHWARLGKVIRACCYVGVAPVDKEYLATAASGGVCLFPGKDLYIQRGDHKVGRGGVKSGCGDGANVEDWTSYGKKSNRESLLSSLAVIAEPHVNEHGSPTRPSNSPPNTKPPGPTCDACLGCSSTGWMPWDKLRVHAPYLDG